ncbi:MAG: Gldg family protein [Chloroflexi bacterium]|nr:Gldg family protein [Chloroflexota bacterium]
MALIACVECGAEVSDRAVACPKCGCPSERAGRGHASTPQRTRLSDRLAASLSTGSLGLALVAFFLPWMDFRCVAKDVAQASGWQLSQGDVTLGEDESLPSIDTHCAPGYQPPSLLEAGLTCGAAVYAGLVRAGRWLIVALLASLVVSLLLAIASIASARGTRSPVVAGLVAAGTTVALQLAHLTWVWWTAPRQSGYDVGGALVLEPGWYVTLGGTAIAGLLMGTSLRAPRADNMPRARHRRVWVGALAGVLVVTAAGMGATYSQASTVRALARLVSDGGGLAQVARPAEAAEPAARQLDRDAARGERSRATVSFVVGHGEPDLATADDAGAARPRPTISALRETLLNHDVSSISLERTPRIPDDTRAIVILGPTHRIPPTELFELDQYLMRGGSIALFVDGVTVDTDEPVLTSERNDTGINDLIGPYGVRINEDIVFDAQCGRIPARLPDSETPVVVPFPAWPRLARLSGSHPVGQGVSDLTLAFASSIQIDPSLRGSSQLTTTVISESTQDQSWSAAPGANLDPFQEWGLGSDRGPFVLAVAVEGRFRSAWANRQAPTDSNSPATGPSAVIQESVRPGRLLIVGDSDLLQDRVVRLLQREQGSATSANLDFGRSVVDWLVQGQGPVARDDGQQAHPSRRTPTPARGGPEFGNGGCSIGGAPRRAPGAGDILSWLWLVVIAIRSGAQERHRARDAAQGGGPAAGCR